ncbi:SMKI13G1515 [Saccharomyces mikatae IFO 1815]|uniref:SMKI13G1515 protein n=1 Tax=Saccharomyces mikatae IFO 1815 TaxID=226126 RepID=A0AA35IRC6_SACMI|nr:uncharacterized protein SMKI_13G1515 [Saccharomyces mikatae IFO 1815]CAI4035502.1 SMKI13G1515 [Saccharomyces mikatae IFO 1815]
MKEPGEESKNDDSAIMNEGVSKYFGNRLLNMLFTVSLMKDALYPCPLFYRSPTFSNNRNLTTVSTLVFASIVSFFLFLLWRERATSKTTQNESSYCYSQIKSDIRPKCSCCLTFFILYVILTCLIWLVHLLPMRYETLDLKAVLQFILLDINILVVNVIVIRSYRIHNLHRSPLVSGEGSSNDEQMC